MTSKQMSPKWQLLSNCFYLPLQPKWSEPRALFSITIPSPTLEFLMFDFSTVGKCNKSKLTPFLIFWPYTQKSSIKNFTSASSPTRYCSISSLASEECPTSSKFSVASPPFYCRTTNHQFSIQVMSTVRPNLHSLFVF